MTRWEYKTLTFDAAHWWGYKLDSHELQAALNLEGAQGWELVSAHPTIGAGSESRYFLAILKRPLD